MEKYAQLRVDVRLRPNGLHEIQVRGLTHDGKMFVSSDFLAPVEAVGAAVSQVMTDADEALSIARAKIEAAGPAKRIHVVAKDVTVMGG